MAKNENTTLKNNHTLYLAKSGYGKSQTFKRTSHLFRVGQRIILWDPNKDHKAHRFEKLSEFIKALQFAEGRGAGYCIAYTGEPSPEAFEIFSGAVWSCLDGKKITNVVIEEYSDCCEGAGPLSQRRQRYHRRLWTQGRKYGAIIHATSQRPQLISKDALGNAGIIYASHMDTDAAKRIAKELDIKEHDLKGCKVGEFYYRNNGSIAEKKVIFIPLSEIQAKSKRTPSEIH